MDDAAEHASLAAIRARFGISRTGLYRLLGRGEISAVKFGRRTLIRVGTIRDYMAAAPPAIISPPSRRLR
jgi:excisionase family DNA binding protein